jgi:hypothetical protein
MNLEEFKQSVDNINNIPKPNQPNMIQLKKHIILSFVSDSAGCGHIRNVFPMTYLNAQLGRNHEVTPMISPFFLWQEDLLARTKTILFQRTMAPEQIPAVRRYKELQARFGYKMVYDIDDFIWGKNEAQGGDREDGVPTYNFGWRGITDEVKKASVDIISMMDKVTVTSEYLKYYINDVLGIKVPVSVLPNAVPMYFYGNKKKPQRKTALVKPRILYTGSPTHYSNQEKLLGDFDCAFKDYIIKAVTENKIEFTVMGDLPYMFEGIRNNIQVIPWLNSYQYHLGIKSVKADIGIGPLVRNNFNYSKSYIKYQEMCAEGIPFIGSVFTNGKPSPYDVCKLKVNDVSTVSEIESLVNKLSNPDFYNKTMNEQYYWLEQTGGYLESPKYVQMLLDNYF